MASAETAECVMSVTVLVNLGKSTQIRVQLWTIKDINFFISGTRIFWTKVKADLNSDGQLGPKTVFFIKFPRGFGCAKYFGQIFETFGMGDVATDQLRTASTDIIARCETCRCCFCFLTAHAAAYPVNPRRYALIKRQDQLINRQITSVGHASRYLRTASFASWNVFLSSSQ